MTMGKVIWVFAAMAGVALGLVLPAPMLNHGDHGLFLAAGAAVR